MQRVEWRLATVMCALGLVALFPAEARSQTATTTTVIVHVVDDVTKTPIVHASVRLVSDSREYRGLTDATGTSRFPNVEPDSYDVITQQRDFAFRRSYTIAVTASSSSSVTVLGTRTRLARIGGVQSRGPAKPDPATTQNADSAAATLAGSAGAALGSLTAVSQDGRSAYQVHNENASLTAPTLNGAPIFPSGANVPGALFSGDIFSSAGVGAGTIGAPDGTLNFSTYDPVIDWEGVLQGRPASFDASAGSIMERGSAGRLGIAVVHANRAQGAPFDSESFADTSGRSYVHNTLDSVDADTLSLRYGFAFNHVGHLDLGRIDDTSPQYCTFQTGPIPCGFGPGNVNRTSTSYVQFRDQLDMTHVSLGINAFMTNLSTTSDLSHELVEDQLVGSFSQSAIRRVGGILSADFALSERRSGSLKLSWVSDAVSVLGQGTALAPLPTQNSTHADLSFDLPAVRTRRFTDTLRFGENLAYGVSAMTYGTSATYALSVRDSLSMSFTGGQLASELYAFNGVDLPQLLHVDCASGRALGFGPTLQAQPPSTQQTRMSYSRQSATYGLSLGAYHNVTDDAVISAVVPATALAPGLFDAGYLGAASSTASSECGAPIALDPAHLYYRTTAPVSRLVNDGLDASAYVDLNPRTSVTAAYSLSLQRGYGQSPLFIPGSTVFSGALLPGLPVSHVNVTARYAASRATTLIADLNTFGANNPYQAKGFGSLDAGIRSKFGLGDIVLAVRNITNAAGRTFQTFDPFPLLTQPYAPRTFSVQARFALGRQNIDRVDYLSRPFTLDSSLIAFEQHDYEPTPSQGWLAPATSSFLCGPELVGRARPYLAAIAQYEAQILQAQTAGTTDVAPVHVGAMTLSRIAGPTGFVIRIAFSHDDRQGFVPFVRCSVIHDGTYDRAKQLGIYIPSRQQREAESLFTMYYAPQVGIYFAPGPVNETGGPELTISTLPAQTPSAPFTVVAACPPSFAPAAAEAAGQLQRYIQAFERGSKPSAPDGFTIAAHPAKTETWLEIRPDDFSTESVLTQCLAIPYVTTKNLTQRGLGGAFVPSINYAPSVGFYNKAG
jgi:hypothetical protein